MNSLHAAVCPMCVCWRSDVRRRQLNAVSAVSFVSAQLRELLALLQHGEVLEELLARHESWARWWLPALVETLVSPLCETGSPFNGVVLGLLVALSSPHPAEDAVRGELLWR